MEMSITGGTSVAQALETFVYTPIDQPDLIPTLLPIILGAVVIELYFGKHPDETLGWNTSVGNAVIWVTTGVNLIVNSTLSTAEEQAAYLLIGVGAFVGYMDFYHKWPDTVAFLVSSSSIVYTLAYITVIFVKTDLAITDETLKAAGIFFVGVNVVFKVIQGFETSQEKNDFNFQ